MTQEIGGFLMPKGLLEDLKASMRRRVDAEKAAIKKLYPDMERDPLYLAMKEVAENAEEFGFDGCDMDWHSCAMLARELMESRGDKI